ncbi:MAG: acyl-CoA reductase [Saprospiraceae bacterium]|nr:acyl-CoA reductase [Saprospiraceae bacterium]
MNITQRVNSLVLLGEMLSVLTSKEIADVCFSAENENPWFTQTNIRQSITAIRDKYLTREAIGQMVSRYKLDDNIDKKRVGLILAGNIPLVGFHDILCCFLAGHISLIKYSDKDKILIPYLIKKLTEAYHDASEYFVEIERLTDYDAVIATGSNTTAKHFEFYFSHVPHIIRKNKNSIAVLSGRESEAQLFELGNDVFSYFGLGCRNVSKIFVPEKYDITQLFEAFDAYKEVIYHHKYKNNYDYNVALFLLNKEKFLQNDMLILKESTEIISRIGSLHYEFYTDLPSLVSRIESHQNELQCVVSAMKIPGIQTIPFGLTQSPDITDYADGVDTMQFLLGL